MKLKVSKKWYDLGADLEGDHAVGAGSPEVLAENIIPISSAVSNLAFGKYVSLQRRALKLSQDELAAKVESDVSEIESIETDPYHPLEPSTVYNLAEVFQIPPRQLMAAAHLVEAKIATSPSDAIRFAASARPTGPLSPAEQHALELFVAALLKTAK